MEIKFCWCGLPITDKMGHKVCKKHGVNIAKPKERKKIGKWSGLSKRPYGAYDLY